MGTTEALQHPQWQQVLPGFSFQVDQSRVAKEVAEFSSRVLATEGDKIRDALNALEREEPVPSVKIDPTIRQHGRFLVSEEPLWWVKRSKDGGVVIILSCNGREYCFVQEK